MLVILCAALILLLCGLWGGPVGSTGHHADLLPDYGDIDTSIFRLSEAILQLIWLLLQLVVFTDDLLVSEVLHILVDAQLHQDVELSLSEYEKDKNKDCDQYDVYEENRDVVGETSIHNVVVTVFLLQPVDIEDVETSVQQDLEHDQGEEERLGPEVVLSRQHDEGYTDDHDREGFQ